MKHLTLLLLGLASSAQATVIVDASGYLSSQQRTNPYFRPWFDDDSLYGKPVYVQMRVDTDRAPADATPEFDYRASYVYGDFVQTTALTIGGLDFSRLIPGHGAEDRGEVWDHGMNSRYMDELGFTDEVAQDQVCLDLRSDVLDFVRGVTFDQSWTLAFAPGLPWFGYGLIQQEAGRVDEGITFTDVVVHEAPEPGMLVLLLGALPLVARRMR